MSVWRRGGGSVCEWVGGWVEVGGGLVGGGVRRESLLECFDDL